MEPRLFRVESGLLDSSWRPGACVKIAVRDPKRCIVCAAPLRDRVVQHALSDVVCSLFEAGFIADSFANRTGKGAQRAVEGHRLYRAGGGRPLTSDRERRQGP